MENSQKKFWGIAAIIVAVSVIVGITIVLIANIRAPSLFNANELTIGEYYKRDSLTIKLKITDAAMNSPSSYTFNADITLEKLAERIDGMNDERATYETFLSGSVLVVKKIAECTSYYGISFTENRFRTSNLSSQISAQNAVVNIIFPAHYVAQSEGDVLLRNFTDGEKVNVTASYAEWKEFYGAPGTGDYIFDDESETIMSGNMRITFLSDAEAEFSVVAA